MKLDCKLLLPLLCLVLSVLFFLQPKVARRTDPAAVSSAKAPGGGIASPIAGRQPLPEARAPPGRERRPKGKSSRRRKDAPRKNSALKYVKAAALPDWMHLAIVACGRRLEETLTVLKSALLFSKTSLRFHIFADDSLTPELQKKLQEWQSSHRIDFDYTIYPITFSVGNAQEWKTLLKPCGAQWLFLPLILQEVDSLLYVDTDVLFLRAMDDIWAFLKQFNATQLVALAPEHELTKNGWYSRFARHPYYGLTGLNSGVVLMNLTRIRKTQFKNSMRPEGLTWKEMMYPLYQKYKTTIKWGNQDLLNIIFHFNPERVYALPCQWNYRPDHCMYGSNCKGAEEEGISILHGKQGVYHNENQPAFKAVYEAIRNFTSEANLFQSLYYPLQAKFLETVHTLCGRIPQVFLKQIETTIKKVYEQRVFVHVGGS
uniref:UDP-D-xylose:beta-D-glucoside alpha-1,3-D-xylosyltransferase n=1 Tax=Geotrypetes seraphini TaxID=260995 RepID=A0A6P8NZP4_GEOSA|nr:glucoside xylosyltransferase 2 isoform X2 [Geotrypetes seraphini]